MKLIDAHCHLETKEFPVTAEVIQRARDAGLVHAVVVGLMQKPGDFGNALQAAREHPGFLTPTMGIHPHDAAAATPADWDELERLAALPEVKAVGEAGLDYYYDHSPRDVQALGFRRQCQLAKTLRKPLVVHVRDAHDECAAILESEGIREGMIHCFTGDLAAARRYLDLGFHLSISGVVTYKKTEPLQEAVRFAPLDRLMVETDSPYLSPVPYRGKWPNEPMRVGETAKKVAELHGRDAEEVALTCARNTVRLLGIDLAL
ncbi:MAG: TatD family hydrolase [Myxococcota bacterium]